MGVLVSLKRDGCPLLSRGASILDGARGRTGNARRDARVTLSVIGENRYRYLVIEGTAGVVDVDPVPLPLRVSGAVSGKPHPFWRKPDEAMVRYRRVVLTISVARLYPRR